MDMEKAIGSRVNIHDKEKELATEYYQCVADILEDERLQKLARFTQHAGTSRLQHCLNVSYYSFLMCKVLGWDYRSAARAGLLHDMYFYDWRRKRCPGLSNHATWHPRVALDNARKMFPLNEIEKDAILKHMWPAWLGLPRYKETYIVTLADKICASMEAVGGKSKKLARFCRGERD